MNLKYDFKRNNLGICKNIKTMLNKKSLIKLLKDQTRNEKEIKVIKDFVLRN